MDSETSGRVYARSADLMSADVSDEMVALDVKNGKCFGFNSVATDIWRMLETPKSIDELKQLCLAAYDVDEAECQDDLETLLQSMSEAGLVTATCPDANA